MLSDLDILYGSFTSKSADDCKLPMTNLSAKKVAKKEKKSKEILRHYREHFIDTVEKN